MSTTAVIVVIIVKVRPPAIAVIRVSRSSCGSGDGGSISNSRVNNRTNKQINKQTKGLKLYFHNSI